MQETTFKHITRAAVPKLLSVCSSKKSGNISSNENVIYARQVKEKNTLTHMSIKQQKWATLNPRRKCTHVSQLRTLNVVKLIVFQQI
jgi:hypothetical protein